ncbi:molybdopterin-binding protein [Sporomusa termitida]|uniref:Molybdopterin molybdenumtransferase n=1 Tax=Sporomusa termitida TaxID=2377 RepID=A0A517DVR2_9FIRM|nr:molybdopterin-binding protein [Sporomusa termitida]QDR81442.1 molybdenum cofactor synthesis domain protein [Sporomusa termitida]
MRVEDSVGCILCHDITKIVPGEFKGRAFKKGHIVTAQDIPELLQLGKEHIFVWECKEGFVHENEAGLRIAQTISGEGIIFSEPSEGKVSMTAEYDGICMIDEQVLLQINSVEEIAVATRNNHRPVKKGNKIAGVRVVPLVIEERKLDIVATIAKGQAVISIQPFHPFRVGIITTGSEIYHGRIEDRFTPVVREKVERYDCKVIQHITVPDKAELIANAVETLIAGGVELILTTGGMSVDPDDVTPCGVKKAGAEIVTYGAPVLPGTMLLVAYLGTVPVLGLPGCVMYHHTTIFDLILPLVLTKQVITRAHIIKLGKGGLCLECDVCQYPACSFGTGA